MFGAHPDGPMSCIETVSATAMGAYASTAQPNKSGILPIHRCRLCFNWRFIIGSWILSIPTELFHFCPICIKIACTYEASPLYRYISGQPENFFRHLESPMQVLLAPPRQLPAVGRVNFVSTIE